MKAKHHVILFITTPVVCILLGWMLMVSHSGLPMDARPSRLEPLGSDPITAKGQDTEILLLYEERTALLETVEDTLREMRLGWTSASAVDQALLSQVHTVLLCTPDLSSLEGEGAVILMDWVEEGGRLALLALPEVTGWTRIVRHKLGIMDFGPEYLLYDSLSFAPGVLPVFDGLGITEELADYLLPVHLEEDCRVLMTAGEGTPLMWTREVGKGRVLVCNHSLISGKDSRGYVVYALENFEDVLVYPIINAGMVFIDDFPAPQPEGFDELLQSQYGLSTQGFFRNHWWPDMKNLVRRHGVRYTGVLVETYNRNMDPPFVPDTDDHALIRYYTSELLQSGGEIGLHGYNHQPLCPDGWPYADEDYITWSSVANMEMAIGELLRYGKSFLPEAEFTSYVPPSNYLSGEGKQALMRTVPSLFVFSGVYLPEEGIRAFVQEFREEEDGSISVPRVTSGFSMDNYTQLVAAGELALHGVFSHFVHPDDVLDPERGALLGWETMSEAFEAHLQDIMKAFPALRWCTATEAAAAVQRYGRLGVARHWDGNRLTLELSGFYDEAWLCLVSERPERVEGAEVHEAGSGELWLRATQDKVILEWGQEP